MKSIVTAVITFALTIFLAATVFADELPSADLIKLGPGVYALAPAPEDLSNIYLSIPLTEEDIELMARMAYGETMYHDGTCPANTVKACYEVVFNRYLNDMNSTDGSNLFHRGALTVSRLLTKGQFEGIVSKNRFYNLPSELQAAYRNLVWQVHNQGPTVLTTEYLYWQSSNGTKGKDNRIWVGFIKDENGNIIEGTTTDKNYIVKGRGNWYRKEYK